jgi:hypothetical protein
MVVVDMVILPLRHHLQCVTNMVAIMGMGIKTRIMTIRHTLLQDMMITTIKLLLLLQILITTHMQVEEITHLSNLLHLHQLLFSVLSLRDQLRFSSD